MGAGWQERERRGEKTKVLTLSLLFRGTLIQATNSLVPCKKEGNTTKTIQTG